MTQITAVRSDLKTPQAVVADSYGSLAANIMTGFRGGSYFADTTAHTLGFSVVQVIADSKFNSLTGNLSGVANATAASAPVIPAGTVLYGAFTAFQLHSGAVIVYT